MYATCIMAFFAPFTFVKHYQLYSIAFSVLITKIRNYIMREKIFLCIAVIAYQVISKEVENHIFRHYWILRHTCMYKKPILAKQWNYNIFVQILYCYFRYTDMLFLTCVLFVACCNIVRASWETKKERLSHRKKYVEEFVWMTSLFWLHALLSMSFFLLSSSISTLSQLTYLLSGLSIDT